MDKIEIFDLVSRQQLQEIQDAFAAVSGITTVVIDLEGMALTAPSNLNGFCEKMQNNAQGVKKCIVTNTSLIQKNLETHDAAEMTCPHSGLTTASVPVMLNGEMLCAWIIGQVRLKDPPDALLEQTASELGVEADKLNACMHALPMITREEFQRVFAFLKVMTDNLIQTGKVNLDLNRSNNGLRHTSAMLSFTADMLRCFIDSSDAGMYVSDYYTGELLLGNREYLRHSGQTEDEAMGQKCWELGGPGGDTFCSYCPRDKLLDEKGRPKGPYRWENYNDTWHKWLRCTNQAVTWADGRLAHMVTYWDTTHEHRMRERLAKIAFYDRQMGLPNAEKLLADLGQDGEIIQTPGLFIIAFDITMLRKLNDAYGRLAVDELLYVIIAWVRAQQYENSTIYRIDGDQFCVLLNGADLAAARRVAEEIFARFRDSWSVQIGEGDVALACNASVSVIDVEGKVADDDLLTLVERTLDVSKKTGAVAVHDAEMDREAEEHIRLEMSLKHCVSAGMEGFAVHFQPIVDPVAGTWKGLEALCRWTSPDIGSVPPPVFIREAEQLGLIDAIGDWVLRRAVGRCKAWGLDKLDGFFVSVNLSPLQILNERLIGAVSDVLREFDYPGEKLSLEVTESEELFFSRPTREAVENLRFRGINIALDDFGTGYSSFQNLKNLPASFLKTEREFINGIEKDSYTQYFFSILAELAHATDMKMIAEGVETQEQLEVVIKNGADLIQGYFFSRPLPPEELEKQLDQFHKVNTAFYTVTPGPLDATLLSSGDAYMITPKLYRVLNQCMRVLLSEIDADSAVNAVLRMAGEGLHVSRTYLYQEENGAYNNTHEWCAEGVSPQIGNIPNFLLDVEAPGWRPLLTREGMVIASDVTRLPADVRRELEPRDVRAIAVFPVWDGDAMVGCIGFDSTLCRQWLPEEITMLRNLSMVMGSSLKREKMRREIARRGTTFLDVLNHLDIPIFVSDLATDEILWANNVFQWNYRDWAGVVGEKCYEVVADRNKRCDYCKINVLEKNAAIRQYNWEHYDPKQDRYYMMYDSIVNWMDGQKVHLGYCIDISDVKDVERQLDYYTLTDSLTGTLSHKRLEERLQDLLAEAHEKAEPLAVVSLDIDQLRKANETYGYSFGDMLIANVVGAVCKVAREDDVVGRTGGDSFSLLMPGCTAVEARAIVSEAKNRLDAQKFTDTDDRYSFAFGVAESSELPYSMGMEHAREVLALAASRMKVDLEAEK